MHTHICLCIFALCLYIGMCTHVYTHVHVFMHMLSIDFLAHSVEGTVKFYVHIYTHMCMYTYIHVCACACMYKYPLSF